MRQTRTVPYVLLGFIFPGVLSTTADGQVALINPGFEEYDQCPDSHGQIDRATGWFTAIITPDFYHCEYLANSSFPSSTLAYAGTGFAGFLCSDASPGLAEAIGQHLIEPLTGSQYSLRLATKAPSGGNYTNNCGGIAVYGFEDTLVQALNYTHASLLPGAMLLGVSGDVTDTAWNVTLIPLTLTDTVAHLCITFEQVSNCRQYVFIDELQLYGSTATAIDDATPAPMLSAYPNPSTGGIRIDCATVLNEVMVHDATGRLVFRSRPGATSTMFELGTPGAYQLSCITDAGLLTKRICIAR